MAGSAVPSLSGGSQPIFDGLDDDESAAANAEGEDAFPIFSLPSAMPDKENPGPNVSAAAAAAAAKAGSGTKTRACSCAESEECNLLDRQTLDCTGGRGETVGGAFFRM